MRVPVRVALCTAAAWAAVAAAGCEGGGTPSKDAGIEAFQPDTILPDDLPDSDARPDIEALQIDYGPFDPGPEAETDAVPDVPPEAQDVPGDLPDAPGPDDAAVEAIGEVGEDAADVPDATDVPGDADAGVERLDQPCETDADCASGWCVQTDQGKVCSRECPNLQCPEGWSCRPVAAPDGNAAFLCVPSTLGLCRPCETVFDCRAGGFPMAGLQCIALGDLEGSFCLPACAGVSDCPPGTTCALPPGASARACLPDEGTCSCSPFAIQGAASTPCSRTADLATCRGWRTCGQDGLSTCDASIPGTEACGGGDEDCDGSTDEEGSTGCTARYRDLDRDGVGLEGDSKCLCAPSGVYLAPGFGDCDDRNAKTYPGAPEACNGRDDDCDGDTDEEGSEGCTWWYPNVDGDGFGGDLGRKCLCAPTADLWTSLGGDCDDGDLAVFPGTLEQCNGIDDDCDDAIDEDGASGCQTFHEDVDGDGYGLGASFQCKCAAAYPFTATRIGDCLDGVKEVYPGAAEACNGRDDDCDLAIDEEDAQGCVPRYLDADGDGFGVDGASRCLCADDGRWRATMAGDCNDSNDGVHPFATELCNGRDDDCNGQTDEAGTIDCIAWFVDADDDGHGDPATGLCLCSAQGDHRVAVGDDCDDTRAFVHPGVQDVCGNGLDDDCDGWPDGAGCSGCTTYFKDVDGDGHGVTGDSTCLESPDIAGHYTAPVGGDCQDGDPAIHPGAVEACNGFDDDCNDLVDEDGATGCTIYFRDADVDRYGVTGESRCLCQPGNRYTATQGGDCDDADRAVNPGRTESCNLVDDDCDGQVDEADSVGCVPWFQDGDGDSYGDDASLKCLCGPSGQWTTKNGGDCNDGDFMVKPGATEKCNLKDDNCNGQTDEFGATGCMPWYLDADGDGYGVSGQSKCLCRPDDTYRAPFAGDCDDADPDRSPGAMEACGNAIDEDCDGATDEEMSLGCEYLYHDVDGDDYGVTTDARCLCAPLDHYRGHRPDDCDDADATVNPGAPERCGGGDENCDGVTDGEGATGCVFFYRDRDVDGYGLAGTGRCLCTALGELRALDSDDCNDANASIHPGATEVCNGLDDDCNGATDGIGADGCRTYYVDQDRDGFGVEGTAQCLCTPTPPQDAPFPGDCDDARALTFPGALENCNGIDDDCNGRTDEEGAQGCVRHFRDSDDDGYGDPGFSKCLCGPSTDYPVTRGDDCDDLHSQVNPDAAESCDGLDNDCNGVTDGEGAAGCSSVYQDTDRDGHGAIGDPSCLCTVAAPWDATVGDDCNDLDAAVLPGATETCNGKDDNCDGVTDPAGASGCTVYLLDKDGDGWGVAGSSKCLCAPDFQYRATRIGDCNDSSAKVYPGATETCNGRDDDCNGGTDEEGASGCKLYYRDSDNDGYGVDASPRCLCAPMDLYSTLLGGDCCDQDVQAHPSQNDFFTQKNKCGSWDFDCSGGVERYYGGGGGSCSGWGIGSGCELNPGWDGPVPDCGNSQRYLDRGCGHCCFLGTCCCSPEGGIRTQSCR